MTHEPPTWHLDDETLREYTEGRAGFSRAASAEAHLLACAVCRGKVDADVPRLDAVWSQVIDHLDAPKVGFVERALHRLGVRPHTARLLAATPSLRLSYLLASVAGLAFAVAAGHGGPLEAVVFLTLAPLLPVLGVAAAFGPLVEPSYEVELATPYLASRLLLVRSLAVLAVTLPLAAAAGALLPGVDAAAAGWMLPALALTGTCLALATRLDVTSAASAVGGAWLVIVLSAGRYAHDPYAAFSAAGQTFALITALAALAYLAMRWERFDVRSTW